MTDAVIDMGRPAGAAAAAPTAAGVAAAPPTAASARPRSTRARPPVNMWAGAVLLLGAIAIAIPTMRDVARESWSTEQGAHGPLVLLTGFWLLWRARRHAAPIAPPPLWRPLVLLAPLLALFWVARVAQIVEIEGFLMYGVLLTAAYAVVGGPFLRSLAFPLFYLAFVFPPPETLVYALTLPMKIAITEAAVALLDLFNYPIGYSGVWIQVGQYQLLVAAACSGLNSIISLSVLATFYIYVRRSGDLVRAGLLALFIVPVAVAANLVRVLILILLTYHAGEAAAQGFLHNFAGMTMFIAALVILFAIDTALGPIVHRLRRGRPAPKQEVFA